MKKTLLAAAMVAAFGHAPATFATNWFQLQNNEQPGAAAYTLWGFVQPTYTHVEASAVNGITAPAGLVPYNGHVYLGNLVGPDLTHDDQLQMFRARPGVRGVIPGTDEKINYFALAELGNNGLTREKHAVFTDATVTFNHIPGARIRAGLGRLPLGEEAMQGVQIMDYINFTTATDQLLNERFVTPYVNTSRTHSPVLGVQFKQSKLTGAIGGFRDVGVEVYDWFARDKMEYAYAVMVSNGNGISFSDSNGSKDVTTRLQAAYVFGGSGPKREDVMAYIWHQEGKRAYNGSDYTRTREGLGAKYLRNGLRVSGEYMRAKGMIYIAQTPQFNDAGGTAFEPVDLMAAESYNKADGYYLDVGWKFSPQWEVDLRYDELSKMTNSAFDERKSTTWTVGGQYFHNPRLRFALNYEIRTVKVPNMNAQGTTGTQAQWTTQLNDFKTILDTTGNRLSAQMTYIF
jgi:hypothetical protein